MSDRFIEALEVRAHLSASLKSGVLVIQGTGGADELSVSLLQSLKGKGKPDKVVVYELNLKSGEDRSQSFNRSQVARIRIVGKGGNDLITTTVPGLSVFAKGGAGNDTITSGAGDDRLIGGAGKDSISGGGGNDYLNGGKGNDSLLGEDGNDTLIGGLGADHFFGGNGRDLIKARDRAADGDILGGEANDTLILDRLLDADPNQVLEDFFPDVENFK